MRRGFSLIELIVVMGITGVLVALILPAAHSVRAQARSNICQTRLRGLGLALLVYTGRWNDQLPHEDNGSTRPPMDCGWSTVLPDLMEGEAGLGDFACPEAPDELLSYKINSKLATEADPFPRKRRLRPLGLIAFFDGRVDNRGVKRAPKGTWALVAERHPEGAHFVRLDGSLTSHNLGLEDGWPNAGPLHWEPTRR